VRVTDPREEELPAVGLLQVEDAETGQRVLLDTASRQVRDAYHAAALDRRETVHQLARASGTDLIEVSTEGDHLEALIRFFRLRERRRRRR
jgi:uncharacterized protein (DUF58 family)